jgi:SAM-dependent methyltransferase
VVVVVVEGDDSYEAVAPAYARVTSRWSRPLAAALVSRASVGSGDHVLDVGTGTGLVAREAAEHVGTDGRVVGIDTSEAMLAEARAAPAGRPNVSFARMAAETLDLPDREFDVALSLFAVTHFADPAAALREMHRVLTPGGRLVLGTGGRAPLLSVAGVTRRVGRVLSLVESGGRSLIAPGFLEGLLREEDAPLREAPHLGLRALVGLVEAAGFERILTSWCGHEGEVESAEEFWELQVTLSTPARRWRARASPAAVETMHERFLRECARAQGRGGRLLYPQGALVVSARRTLEDA